MGEYDHEQKGLQTHCTTIFVFGIICLNVRFAEWNIQSGGFEGYDRVAETPRYLPDIREGVQKLNADFISLIDTFRWDELYSQEDLERTFGYVHAMSVPLGDDRLKALGHDNGITVLSNLPVSATEVIRIATRNAIKTSLRAQGQPLDVFSVYLDDVREKNRLEQMRALLQHVSPEKHTIIMGDFNCISDTDVTVIIKALAKLLKTSSTTMRTRLYSVEDKLAHRGVIRFLEASGFVDGSIQKQPTTPTHKLNFNVGPFLRLDYAFHTPEIVMASTEVVRGTLFDRASDHFPLVVEIEHL